MKKRGMSAVIATVILIVLVLTLISIVWAVVNNLVGEQIDETESCFGIFDKIEIQNRYTYYDSGTNELEFSISVKDIKIDELVVVISSKSETRTYKITNSAQTLDNLRTYPSITTVKLPGENSGMTYIASNFAEKPDSIKISPIINEKQCEMVDSLSQIETGSIAPEEENQIPGSTIVMTQLNIDNMNFESSGGLTGWILQGTSVDWTEQTGSSCDMGSCAYTIGDSNNGVLSYPVNLAPYDACYIQWRYKKNSLDSTSEYLSFQVYDTSYHELWRARYNEAPNNAWSSAPSSNANVKNDVVNWQGSQWINLTESGLSSIVRLSFIEAGTGGGDFIWVDNVNVTCERVI